MQSSDTNGNVLDIIPGTKLRIEESAAIEDVFGFLLSQIAQGRGDSSPSHTSLCDAIGKFLENRGSHVEYRAPILVGVANPQGTVFDVIERMDDKLSIIQVTTTVSQDDIDGMHGHINGLRTSGILGKLYFGTDILTQGDLVSGTFSGQVKDLLTNQGVGVILADDLFVAVCENFDQLMLDEMPTFLFQNRSIG